MRITVQKVVIVLVEAFKSFCTFFLAAAEGWQGRRGYICCCSIGTFCDRAHDVSQSQTFFLDGAELMAFLERVDGFGCVSFRRGSLAAFLSPSSLLPLLLPPPLGSSLSSGLSSPSGSSSLSSLLLLFSSLSFFLKSGDGYLAGFFSRDTPRCAFVICWRWRSCLRSRGFRCCRRVCSC